MNERIIKLLLLEWRIIDAFVISMDDETLTSIWHSICSRSRFRDNSLLTTYNDSCIEVFKNYEQFIYSISPEHKIDYINFYEDQLQKPWKEKFLEPIEPMVGYSNRHIETTKWWEQNAWLSEY